MSKSFMITPVNTVVLFGESYPKGVECGPFELDTRMYELLFRHDPREVGEVVEGGARKTLTDFNVEELQGLLRDADLPVSGKKAELIARILEHNAKLGEEE